MENSTSEQPSSSTSSPSQSVCSGQYYFGGLDGKPIPESECYCFDVEEVFIVSQKYRDGGWNKLVKSQERWWYNYREALQWLSEQEGWFQQANAIFKCTMAISDIEKVFDGKEFTTST